MHDQIRPTRLLEEELRDLKAILGVAQGVVASLDLAEVLSNILASAMAIMEMPAGCIALYDEKSGQLERHTHAGLNRNPTPLRRWGIRPGGMAEKILQGDVPLAIESTAHLPSPDRGRFEAAGIRALIGVPLKIKDRPFGILYLDDFTDRTFPSGRLRLLSILASFASMSIENAQLHQKTRHLACTDGLTGLFNYRHFKKTFGDEMARSIRYHKPLSLIMFDVDDFKKFNDSFGHPVGDQVLAGIAEILRRSLREVDLIFRYGGEEFIAILPEAGIDEAVVAAERARRAIQCDTPAYIKEIVDPIVTVSVGVANFPLDGHDADALLKATDDLLLRAKKEGKNQVYHFHPA
jgi:diguanylate cyclase (GGDEF)-like protein